MHGLGSSAYLRNDRKLLAEGVQPQRCNVDAVNGDGASVYIDEAEESEQQAGLPASCAAH